MTKYNCYFFSSQQKYFTKTETNTEAVPVILVVFVSTKPILEIPLLSYSSISVPFQQCPHHYSVSCARIIERFGLERTVKII